MTGELRRHKVGRLWLALVAAVAVVALGSPLSAAPTVSNRHTRVLPVGELGRWTGFTVQTAAGRPVAEVRFGSLRNLWARRLSCQQEKDGTAVLRFTALQADPTPRFGPGSFVSVRLEPDEPFPQVRFRLELTEFDRAGWQQAFGTVPFHFLACSVPGAEVFHQRGWSLMTPVLDPYPLHGQATGYGKQIVSEWSGDWTYAPPVGAYPVATVGLWKPSEKKYVAYDFHGARLTDHSEKDVGSAYCWRLERLDRSNHRPPQPAGPESAKPPSRSASHRGPNRLTQFFTLVWPAARPYREGLRYPNVPSVVATHFRLLYSLDLPGDDDPNYFVQRFVWKHYADRLPPAPKVVDLSWLPEPYRLKNFPPQRVPRSLLHRVSGRAARWWEPGTLVFSGLTWDGDPVTLAYQRGDQAAVERLRSQIRQLLPYARHFQVEGQPCVAWQQCLEGQGKLKLFGTGVPTVRHVANWQLGLALLDVYRNQPQAERELLPYVDGLLRFTRHVLTTRNGYADVPTSPFCWSCGPITTFCLRYYFTFRDAKDEEHRRLAHDALQLAHRMLFRFLPVWASDSDPLDDLDSSFLLEPNGGVNWLGSACSNEVWVVVYALAQVYVHTGDPLVGHYLLGALERWPQLFREEYFATLREYDGAFTERLGLYDGAAQPKGTRASYGGLWGLAERLLWPVGSATVRVLCGEKAALAFNRRGVHTDLADYRFENGDLSFRLVPVSDQARQAEPFDVVVTVPYFDVRRKPVLVVRGGRAERWPEERVQRFEHRPDSLLVKGLRYGDTVALGSYKPDRPVLPCPLAKPRRSAVCDNVRLPAGFHTVSLLPYLNRRFSFDWDDPSSWAGWLPGRSTLFGVPFDLLDPVFTGGRLAVRDAEVPVRVDVAGTFLFALVGELSPDARLTVVFDDGSRRDVDLSETFPVRKGWPPCFTWHVDWAATPLEGKRVRSLEVKGLSLFAATLSTLPRDELSATLLAVSERLEQARQERRRLERVRQLRPLLERLSGPVGVLPSASGSRPQGHPLVKLVLRAGLLRHFRFLSVREASDPQQLTPRRFPLLLYLGGEAYPTAVDSALQRYLQSGGVLLVLARPGQPFPFFYDERGRPVRAARRFGLHVRHGWERPPSGVRLAFRRNEKQQVLTSVPERFPFPTEGDSRWRPIENDYGPQARYTALLTLVDQSGRRYGDAAAWVELTAGPLAGASVGYAWSGLLDQPDCADGLLVDLLRFALSRAAEK